MTATKRSKPQTKQTKASAVSSDDHAAEPKDKLLPRMTMWFFKRTAFTALLWAVIVVFGVLSYTTLLKREGFPPIDVPYAVITGGYFANDPQKVDSQVAKPLGALIMKQSGVKSVQSQSYGNFFTVVVQYNEGTDAKAVTENIKQQVAKNQTIPAQATITYTVPKFGYTQRGDDVVISVYSNNNSATTEQLTAKATEMVAYLNKQNISLASDISLINPYEKAVDPTTGQASVVQKLFDRYGERKQDQNLFFDSVAIGMLRTNGADILQLNDQVEAALTKLNADPAFEGYTATLSASLAPQIREQISELQRVLLEGLIAVLVIGSIVIAFRASIITVISMVTVLATTLGLLYLLGYSLNTITLFALILSLSLIVDDTIIMVEAIDVQRKRARDAFAAVRVAVRKVSRAMVAATLTAALSFAPLLFVGGILGGFIRAIPVTIISALLISLLVALIFIPMFARGLLLGKKQMGEEHVKEVAAGFERRIARGISAPMLWAKGSRKKLFGVGVSALVIGFGFIFAGGMISRYVAFNIFPEDKDSNQLTVTLAFPPQTSITTAQAVADNADQIVGKTIGGNFEQASYFASGTSQGAQLTVELTNYSEREETSPQIVQQLDKAFTGFQGASVKVAQVSAGPPASDFVVQIDATNRDSAMRLANDVAAYLQKEPLKRPDGTTANVKAVTVSSDDVVQRDNGKTYVSVTVAFADKDTTTLVSLAQKAVEDTFTADKLKSYGLSDKALSFTAGMEDDNQKSFQTLVLAFPLVLLAIYILLAFQFRSLLQPILIFMALPFSFFGIALGLYLTDNPFSFFAMLGFFALIGLSIKNTILLTDYANQSRRAGLGAVDAAHEALAERFRPLIATSLTAVVSLIPLAITSPFWEGLAVVLIFGLVSSTFFVVTVFPYYYLGAEYLRSGISRKVGLLWLVLTLAIVTLIGWLFMHNPAIAAPIIGIVLIGSFIGSIWYAGRAHV